MTRPTRPISWVSAAQRNIQDFPEDARLICVDALTIAAEGGKADIAKPLKGFGTGVLEIALSFRGNAFRVIYALHLGADVWVVHVFQKKANRGIRTPKHEKELIRYRLKRLKEILR